ncbi:MAG: GNAT family N-acetyltransferase [Nocardioidaceae bacterium]|nr:GNAT family N-acetyltransferase [Nocardioidaceae bacterium]
MTGSPTLELSAADDMATLRSVAELFGSVWGRTPEGLPVSSEILKSMVHAGGLVSVARSGDELVGAAVLGRDDPGAGYGYIAAVRPGLVDHGVGFALKQHQRSWSLQHGITVLRWTFDPLVARNARFNLTKLGAVARDYQRSFYGHMSDLLNGDDESDRLVPEWRLDSPRAVACAAGRAPDPGEPPIGSPELVEAADGPDRLPAYAALPEVRWVRAPADIVALRRSDPAQASAWRGLVRERLGQALCEGYAAVGVSCTGWYRLDKELP